MPTRLEGIFVAAVTPRRAQEHCIDLGATLELIDFLGASGVAGIALLGSTGEFVHFAIDDRRHMVNLAAKRSRVPLLVNVSYSTLDGAIELARDAAAAGVAGVMLMPPYYFRQSHQSIRGFYRTFAAEVGEATPIYLYNIPACTTEIDSALAAELLSTGLFAGIKDSSGSLDYFRALQQQAAKTPFTLFAGHERIYRQCKEMGAQGIVSGVASALPELMVALDRALAAGAEEKAAHLETLLAEFLERVEIFPWPAGVKHAARQRKLKTGALAAPLGPEGERKLAEFGEWFEDWLPGVLRECGR
ncbi:MAG TPA: dihydrodipicolinate synthase family protein [Bryobacteraceae bacterium]|nr:dihydrodipicolinate synthase family protein [Bryobacteraceae bacterium]